MQDLGWPHEIACTPELVRRDGRGLIKVVFYLARRCVLEQSDRQVAPSADLADPRLLRTSITEIDWSWGFNNAAHFSRSFKIRLGSTPSDCRAAARADQNRGSISLGKANHVL